MVLSALGCSPTFQCSLGRDIYASRIIQACQGRGIRMVVDCCDAPTARHLNLMDDKGGRYSIFLSSGDPDPQIDERRLRREIQLATTIFLSLSASSKKVLHLLRDSAAEVLLDLHDYDGANPWYDDFIDCADVIQLSDVALQDVDSVINRLLSGRARQIVLTRGERGAEIFTETGHEVVPVCPAQMVDSNGAGDAFSVALWLGQANGLSLSEAGKFAATAAAFAIECDSLFPIDVSFDHVKARAARW